MCTGDALKNRITATKDGLLTTPDSITYSALIIEDGIYISPASQEKIQQLQASGVRVLHDGTSIQRQILISEGKESVVHTHRIINGKDVFFIANVTTEPVSVRYTFPQSKIQYTLRLSPGESTFVRKR